MIMYFHMIIAFYLSFTLSTVFAFPQGKPALGRRGDAGEAPRRVFLLITTDLYKSNFQSLAAIDAQDIRESIYHAAIEIQGDGVNYGSMRLDLDLIGDQLTPDIWAIRTIARVREYGLGNPTDAPVNKFSKYGQYTRAIEVGSISLSNDALLDTNGKGVAQKVWERNPTYSSKTNNCIMFVKDMMTEMGLKPSPSVSQSIFDDTLNSALMTQRHGTTIEHEVPLRLERYPPKGGDESLRETWAFDVTEPDSSKLLAHIKGETVIAGSEKVEPKIIGTNIEGVEKTILTTEEYLDHFRHAPPSEISINKDTATQWSEIQPDRAGPAVPLSDADTYSSVYGVIDDDSDTRSVKSGGSEPKRTLSVTSASTEIALVKTGGALKSVLSIGASSLEVVGVAAAAVGALYIIIDIVNGDYKGAAFGAASVAAGAIGIALDLLVAGPIGTFVGLVAGVLLAILPGLFDSFNKVPPSNNPAQILQYAMFGDKDITGNEKCNDDRKKHGLSPNCTAVYGAGVISKIMKFNYFDSAILLYDKNQGHAISIPDLAAKLVVKDYTVPNWGSDTAVYIDCGRAPPPRVDRPGISPGSLSSPTDQSPKSGYSCDKPKFVLNRNLTYLPTFNKTADQLYGRIIPAPGGDCKIVSDPIEGFRVPVFDITITGRPLSIACNLTDKNLVGVDGSTTFADAKSSGQNITTYSQGTTVAFDVASNTTSTLNYTLTTTSNSSTLATNATGAINRPDGVVSSDNNPSRAYTAPAPPVEFLSFNETNSVCLTSPGGRLCLPSGSYSSPPTGAWGFNTRYAKGITFPGKPSFISFDLKNSDVAENPSTYDIQGNNTVTFSENIPPGPDQLFKKNMNSLSVAQWPYTIVSTKDMPGACLYSQNNFGGEVVCFGVGGNNLTGPWVGQASSISFRMNASAWIYGEKYGDMGGVQLTKDVPDLSTVAYGGERNFNKQIKALWIRASPG